MSLSSDEFDSEIRGPLYDIKHAFTVLGVPMNTQTEALYDRISEAIQLADDYRVDLLDNEDQANEESHE